MSKFKIGLSIVFSAFIVIGIIIFATSKGASSNKVSNITMWGFIPQSSFSLFLQNSAVSNDKTLVFSYVQKNPATFENDFINAIANGVAPDIVMISQDMLLQNKNKIFPIPFQNYSERTFKDSFIQEGELFLSSTGAYAIPFTVDPLVMYWNRDIFNSASLSTPPKYFDEFLTLPAKVSKTDASGNVTQSAVALGEWNNVNDAKAILSDILQSAGNSIIDMNGAYPRSTLADSTSGQAITPANASVNFFTQFVNPTSNTYSWNRSLPNSLSYFLSGNLAIYFGFASELASIRAKNPNLNFDVAFMPQPRQSDKKSVFGNIYGLAIVKQSKNISAAFTAITELTTDSSITKLGTYTNLPPVKRSLYASAPTSAYETVFYQSALVSSAWLDPNITATNQIFQNMIESITSGQARASDAILTANDELDNLLK